MNDYVILSEGKDATVLVLDKDGTYKRMVTFHYDAWEFPVIAAESYIEQRKETNKVIAEEIEDISYLIQHVSLEE